MIRSDYHIHTYYCDGKNSPGEIAEYALSLGMKNLGFSGHSYFKFDDPAYSMSPENTIKYLSEIKNLKNKYADSIKILCGTECDYYSDINKSDYNYLIGSVHYIFKENKYLSVDFSPENFAENIKNFYDGDAYKFVEDYFRTVADVYEKIQPDIIGHFDLINKFNEKYNFFDENNNKYLEPAFYALDELLKHNVIFEINTGAVSRGWRKAAYPAEKFLKYIAQKNGRVILSSDSHNKLTLMYDFDIYEDLARSLNLNLVEEF